jgi:hypothetical protein
MDGSAVDTHVPATSTRDIGYPSGWLAPATAAHLWSRCGAQACCISTLSLPALVCLAAPRRADGPTSSLHTTCKSLLRRAVLPAAGRASVLAGNEAWCSAEYCAGLMRILESWDPQVLAAKRPAPAPGEAAGSAGAPLPAAAAAAGAGQANAGMRGGAIGNAEAELVRRAPACLPACLLVT